jgi:hypothetical protein
MTGNTTLVSHPSYLALDRAALGAPSAELASHIESCPECRAHVEAVTEPAPGSGIVTVRQRIDAERRSKLRSAVALLPLLAAAAGVSFVLMRPQPDLPAGPRESEPYIGTKGFSSVWIYVKHGANSELWDGKRPLFAGDRLRLKLDPGQFRYVAVYSIKKPSEPALLYSGSVEPGQSVTLPDAWEVDAEPGAERLLVAFSTAAVEPDWSDWLRGKAPPGVTLLPFVLPKSSAPDRDGGASAP